MPLIDALYFLPVRRFCWYCLPYKAVSIGLPVYIKFVIFKVVFKMVNTSVTIWETYIPYLTFKKTKNNITMKKVLKTFSWHK